MKNSSSTNFETYKKRTPAALTVEYLLQQNLFQGPSLFPYDVHSITVRGAVAVWVYTLEHFGSGELNFETIVKPAIDLAENETLKIIATHGKDGFYKGRVADAIIDAIKSRGGITALLALGIFSELEKDYGLDLSKLEHNSAEYLHIIIEVLRLTFADTRYYVTDPQALPIPTEKLLSKEYFSERAKLIDFKKRNNNIGKGYPDRASDAVYFSVVDKRGSACSFMCSNCISFDHALDLPRICIFPPSLSADMNDLSSVNLATFTNINGDCIIYIEKGIGSVVVHKLEAMGHTCRIIKGYGRSKFGRCQIIRVIKKDIGYICKSMGLAASRLKFIKRKEKNKNDQMNAACKIGHIRFSPILLGKVI
ncbi:nucleophile aminohydrolase [Phascolomyces articulosus]|uniref:Nucleophile aminohydrolase n=1 Tax=Phascolomyces articulosus TaxID=60185 RepID=A0AAD5JP72_9FUNG|nr:nucleophile aminohydrolase [Phascolomyces articulosus]